MIENRTYPPGVPCWVDCAQPDVDAACTFYADLLDWNFEDVQRGDGGGRYVIASLDGGDVAALASSDGDSAHWNTYIAVDDARQAATRVWEAGGRVVTEPVEVGPAGWLGVCEDPTGAVFRLWQAGRRLGAQRVNQPGGWIFCDLRTTDPERALAFYGAVFGWESMAMGPDAPVLLRQPGYGDHLAATVDPSILERQRAVGAPAGFADAVAWLGPLADEPASRWNVTFGVADRDRAVAEAEAGGAEVLGTEDSQWARTAAIRDPQGARLSLSQFTPPGS